MIGGLLTVAVLLCGITVASLFLARAQHCRDESPDPVGEFLRDVGRVMHE